MVIVSRRVSPVVLVPGMTASDLYDQYEMPPEAVWTTVRKRHYDRIRLHPVTRHRFAKGHAYELREPARVAPAGPFPPIYEDLVEELRDGLSEDAPGPVPVFPFGYDWRMPLDRTEERLAAFVREVVDRTLLLRHYRDDPAFAARPTVTLIGHSMGGLIIAGYLEAHSGRLVDKVVTLASPFRGSHEAVLKVATGTADFGDDSGKARERRAARMTPALYHLLPDFEGGISVDEGIEPDIFTPEAWQPSVVRTIEREVEGWGVSGAELFAEMLGAARAHRERISALRLADDGEGRGGGEAGADRGTRGGIRKDDWLAVVGVGAKTRVGLRVRRDGEGTPRFDLRSAERRDEWESGKGDSRLDTGDGTVPLRGAVPPFLDESRLVCVTGGDFGYWEVRDRAMARFAGLHAMIPKMNMLHRMILRFLLGKGDPYGNTWGRRFPGVGRGEWRPPLALADKG